MLGAPMRSAARLFGAYPGPARGAAIGVIVALIVRGLLCAAFAALFGLPYLGALGAAALIAWTIVRLGRAPAAPLEPGVGSFAARLAETINDTLGACLPLVALALFVQQSWPLLAVAVALALAASAGPVIAARRLLRSTPLRAALAAAALVAALGEMLVAAPPVSGWIGGFTGANLIAPAALAALDARGRAGARQTRQTREAKAEESEMAAVEIHVQGLFATPVAAILLPGWEERNAALTEIILRRRETHPGIDASNNGGWHSSRDFPEWGGPHGRDLHRQGALRGRRK